MKTKYTIRQNCIFCNNPLTATYFETDYKCSVGHFTVEIGDESNEEIPYNVYICNKCNTPQIKYLGDLNEIYRVNHADSTGTIMMELHEKMSNILLNHKPDIHNIIEIGSSRGVLADLVLSKLDNTIYNIIEPCFFGDTSNKVIYNDFYENIDDTKIDANTLVISHVFEHFYEPLIVLDKIYNNPKIENFILAFPDLEYYINNNVLHVLNTEHTYYVDNAFLIEIIKRFGFDLIEQHDHYNHSVIFYFKRASKLLIQDQIMNLKNQKFSLDKFYNTIFNNVDKINTILDEHKDHNIYLWPASIHCLFLFIFGLKNNITGFLDNSKKKENQILYGTNKKIHSFNKIINDNNQNTILILNGGVFSAEVKSSLDIANNIKYHIL